MVSRIVLEECDILTNTFIFIDHVTANDRNRVFAGQYEPDLEIGALEQIGCERVLAYETGRAKSEYGPPANSSSSLVAASRFCQRLLWGGTHEGLQMANRVV